jgi:FkbM family methyltransferase
VNWLNRLFGSDSPKFERPARAMAGYLMQRTRRFEHVQIQRDGYELPFFADSNVALTYWAVPDLVDPTEQFVRSLLRPGQVFVDVGANVGTVAALAADTVGRTGRVLAIEPHPRTFGLLGRTIAANGLANVACVEVACGSTAGMATLTDERRKDDNNKVDPNQVDGAGTGVAVRSATLAALLEEHDLDHVDLVKIDVEGFEGAVLRGLGDAFSKIGAFHVEVIERNLQRYGDSTAGIISLLQGHGFACFQIIDDPSNLVAFSNDAPAPPAAVAGQLKIIPGDQPPGFGHHNDT